ncbi:MAG TPA: hypothetical protein PKD31_28860, partial [Blastocatellia bacterium]|nr:hypothetical protein [Blastocatellia bacterium]
SMSRTFEYQSELPVPAGTAYEWHTRPGAFERLLPPWDTTRVVERSDDVQQGRVVLEVPIGPATQRWVSDHHLPHGLSQLDGQ